MVAYTPRRIIVQPEARYDDATVRILKKLPYVPVELVDKPVPGRETPGKARDDETGNAGDLVLMRYPGRFLKLCQGAGAEICCNCLIASYGYNCHYRCTYCVLQSYLNNPGLVVFTNIGDLTAELGEILNRSPKRIFRVGTGELADSLALDHLTGFSRELVPFFSSTPNGILELKTKSVQIENLQGLDHGRHTIVSWSMNSEKICRSEEIGTPDFHRRVEAALRCQEWGYRLGFHFDPIIHYPGWEADYRQAVREIFHIIDPSNVVWISLGTLRFTPRLRDIIRKRYPESKIPYGEFIPGHHGKLRYFRPIRQEMYRKIHSWIREAAPQVWVYLCMESRIVWENSIGCEEGFLLPRRMDEIFQTV
jgi:spore photoproduct lyase